MPEITLELFNSYVKVRDEGNYNMIMDADKVIEILKCSKSEYYELVKNFNEYSAKFNK